MPKKNIGIVVFANSYPEGIFIPDIIANYVYDKLLGKTNLKSKYAKEIEDYPGLVDKFKQPIPARLATSTEKFDERLLGVYHNQAWGTITISNDAGLVKMKVGPAESHIVAELLPYGDGKYLIYYPQLFGSDDFVKLYWSQNEKVQFCL